MTFAIFDFADIRARMLGDDKPAPKPPAIEVKPALTQCLNCGTFRISDIPHCGRCGNYVPPLGVSHP